MSLALEAKVPVEEIAQLYEAKHAELDQEARIKSFLPIFALRGVQDVLRQRRGRRVLALPERAQTQPYGAWVGGEITA